MKNYFGTLRLKNRQLYDKEITEKKKERSKSWQPNKDRKKKNMVNKKKQITQTTAMKKQTMFRMIYG